MAPLGKLVPNRMVASDALRYRSDSTSATEIDDRPSKLPSRAPSMMSCGAPPPRARSQRGRSLRITSWAVRVVYSASSSAVMRLASRRGPSAPPPPLAQAAKPKAAPRTKTRGKPARTSRTPFANRI